MWMTNELLPKSWVFLSKFRWSLSPSKLEGHMRSSLGGFPFFIEQATCTLVFFLPNPSGQVVHNHHLVLRGKKNTHSYWHHMWKITSPKFASYIWAAHVTASQNKQYQPNKNVTCLEYEVFICYFGPHGSGHQPTPVDTFHPWDYHMMDHKPIIVLDNDPFRVAWALKAPSTLGTYDT